MKVIHLPTAVGGNAWALAQGEKTLGLDSSVYVAVNSWINYPADYTLFTSMHESKLWQFKYGAKCLAEAFRLSKKFDVYHFNFGSSLLNHFGLGINNLDLPLYKGKIVVTYNGCDARQKNKAMKLGEIHACHNETCNNGSCNSGKRDKHRENAINKFDRFADVIFALNPDLLNFLPERACFLPYALFPCTDLSLYEITKEKLRVVHAPTNREIKGTQYILEAIDKIQKKYGQDSIELILIENRSHEEAMQLYNKADLVIDQLLIGWYGAFAGEVMQMGKPVMAYIRESDLINIPNDMKSALDESIINVNPKTIYDKLCEVMENRDLLLAYSRRGFEYVNEFHDYRKIAASTKAAYEE